MIVMLKRQTKRQTDRQTDRKADLLNNYNIRKTDRQTDRQRLGKTDGSDMTTATNGHRLTLTQGEWGRERHRAREIGGERDRRQKRPVVRETGGEEDQWVDRWGYRNLQYETERK